jgi:hypothetical protein
MRRLSGIDPGFGAHCPSGDLAAKTIDVRTWRSPDREEPVASGRSQIEWTDPV